MKAMRVRALAAALGLMVLVAPLASAQWTWTPQTGRWVNMKRLPKESAALQLEYARGLMLQGAYDKALDEVNKFDNFYGDDELADENQYLRAEIRMAQGRLMPAAEAFQKLLVTYPDSDLYSKAIENQYKIGDELFEQGKARQKRHWRPFQGRPLRRAADVYTMVIDNRPFTEEAAEAQYKLGLVQFTRSAYSEATYEYNRVIGDYPSSQWVPEAMYGLTQCYYEMALPPEYNQEPSQLAVEKIDDFTSRYPQDPRTPELEGKRSEMRDNVAAQRLGIAKFYEKRRNFKAAEIYYEVVAEQFPETPAAEKAKAWLDTRHARQEARQEDS